MFWPTRTARQFVSLVADRKFTAAESMLELVAPVALAPRSLRWQDAADTANIDWLPQDINDVVGGRQRFVVGNSALTFTAQFGKISVWNWGRTIWLPFNQSTTVRVLDSVQRIEIHNGMLLQVETNKDDPLELVLHSVPIKGSDRAGVRVWDASGNVYMVTVAITEETSRPILSN